MSENPSDPPPLLAPEDLINASQEEKDAAVDAMLKAIKDQLMEDQGYNEAYACGFVDGLISMARTTKMAAEDNVQATNLVKWLMMHSFMHSETPSTGHYIALSRRPPEGGRP